MVEHSHGPEGASTFVIWPHSALNWAGMRRLLCVLTAAIAAVAVYFALQGAWLVLPFAGLEALVVCGGIYMNARRAVTREVVRLVGPDLVLSRGRRHLAEVARLPRYWTRVALVRDPRGWYPSRLFLESHGRRLEVGAVLTEAERDTLAADLRSRLGPAPALHLPRPAPVPHGLPTTAAYE
jgi:uncharacterized membrane protein